MQLYFSEFKSEYENYEFPYQVYCKSEFGDDWSRIYASGFVTTRHLKNVFYLCRSSRIKLSNFQLNSENRRILKKVEDINLIITPITNFNYDLNVQKFCAQSSIKIGKGKQLISTSNIKYLFSGNANTNFVATYINTNNEVVGYSLLVVTGTFCHYAYPFPASNTNNLNLNIGMMTKFVDWSHKQHKQFVYLGTVNSDRSIYKTNFDNFEFFTGWDWSSNIKQLKERLKRISNHIVNDQNFLKEYYDEQNIFDGNSVVRTKFK